MTARELLRRTGMLLDRYLMHITTGLLVVTFFFIVFIDRIVVTIPAGHAGVLWKRLAGGTVVDRIYGEGLRLILPWDLMTIYDLRFQHVEKDFDAVDRDGLKLTLKVSTRLRIEPDTLGHLHKRVGPNYIDVVLVPEVGSQARNVISSRVAEAVYATERSAVEKEILARLREGISIHGYGRVPDFEFIRVEDVLIRDIILPPLVAAAVEQKIQQFHAVQEWRHRLDREQLESRRKQIEGEGIRRFQAEVTPGISDQYLRWKGIDATLKLAESANAKIVIIGSGPQGLPVILGSDVLPSPPARPGPRTEAPADLQPTRPLADDVKEGTSRLAAPPPATAGGFREFIGRVLGLGQ